MGSGGVVRWDSSQLCESELLWSCCYPQCSGMQSESLVSFQGWTPNPSVLSAPEGSGLSGDGAFVGGRGSRGSYAVACAPLCWHCGSLSRWVQRRSGTLRRRRSLGRKGCGLGARTWRPSLPRRRASDGSDCQGHIPARCPAHWGGGIRDDDQTATEDGSQTTEKERENFDFIYLIYIIESVKIFSHQAPAICNCYTEATGLTWVS